MTRVLVVVGARPNFVKVAPVLHALGDFGVDCPVLHTGQHYDWRLSGAFLEQLGFPEPAYALGVGSGTHGQQTASVLVGVEGVLHDDPVDAVLVAGDVNSTMAAAIAAAKAGVQVVHLEAGLRSGDWTMPEEINRAVTDRISDLLLCPSPDAAENLAREGVQAERVRLVGNTMIDSLFKLRGAAEATGVVDRLGLTSEQYILATLHRPALVDHDASLRATLAVLAELTERLPVLLPLHPRTANRLAATGSGDLGGLTLLEPLDYLEFVGLQARARLVITDSGGVQEETSALGVPCLTYRTTTERPITVTAGTNRLVGVEPAALRLAAVEALDTPRLDTRPIPLWDGSAGPRAAEAIVQHLRTC